MTLNRFAKFAWFVVIYNILVILWGAFVRASFSGAGCGSHWPLCNGEVVPMNPSVERVIEFAHRASSGIALLLVIALIVWAFRAYPWGLVRKGALATGVFIITESLLGASLVLFGWVAFDRSVWRVYSMGLHLVNTFLLLGAMTLTAWWASGGKAIQFRERPTQATLYILALIGVVLIGMTGAITALGDTLFPAQSLAQGVRQHFDPTANFLIQLSIVHPFIAVGVSAYLWFLTVFMKGPGASLAPKFALAVRILIIVQLIAGVTNILLLAPIWLQIVHLLLADLLWLAVILYGASYFAAETAPTPESTTPRGAVNVPAE